MVDLETIEALYENVGVTALFTAQVQLYVYEFLIIYFIVNVSESTARGTGENQKTLRDVRGRGRQTAGQTRTVSISSATV